MTDENNSWLDYTEAEIEAARRWVDADEMNRARTFGVVEDEGQELFHSILR